MLKPVAATTPRAPLARIVADFPGARDPAFMSLRASRPAACGTPIIKGDAPLPLCCPGYVKPLDSQSGGESPVDVRDGGTRSDFRTQQTNSYDDPDSGEGVDHHAV